MGALLEERAHQINEKLKIDAALHGAKIKEDKKSLAKHEYTNEDYDNMSQEELDKISDEMMSTAFSMFKDLNNQK